MNSSVFYREFLDVPMHTVLSGTKRGRKNHCEQKTVDEDPIDDIARGKEIFSE